MATKVSSIMTRDPVTLSDGDALRIAVDLELKRRIRHFPVLSKEGKLVGILTDRDIKRGLPSPLAVHNREDYERMLNETPVTRLMTKDPITVTSQSNVEDAVRIMLEKRIGGLPVVDEGVLVGVVTQTDALKLLLAVLEDGR